MSEIVTLAGTTVSVSAGVPATYDVTGFAALTYTEVGEVTNLGDRGRTYEDVSYTTLGERGTVHLKGTYDEPETPLEMIAKRSNPGQVIMKAGSKTDDDFSFKVEYTNGDIDYFQSKIFSYVSVGGDANTIRAITSSIRVHRNGVVEVDGPTTTTFTLTYTAGANGTIIGTSPQTVSLGNDGEPVAAAPASTYAFVDWSDGSTENPRLDEFVQGDVTVTANFALA